VKLPLTIALLLLVLLAVACADGEPPGRQPDQGAAQETSPPPRRDATPGVDETAVGFSEIGSDSIWDPREDEARLQRILDCAAPVLSQCAAAAMEEFGASQEAVDFFTSTGWFLVAVRETGEVDVGSILTPFRANSIGDFALLNGTPSVVVAEEHVASDDLALHADPVYEALLTQSSDLILWPSDNLFEDRGLSPDGDQRFIFQHYLVDGCHACTTDYLARYAFDFASDGAFQGAALLGPCRLSRSLGTPTPVVVPLCPPPAAAAPTEVIPGTPLP
jgi:hypothetical protein